MITPGWPTLHCDAEAQPRSGWSGNPLAEILKVREANRGGCCAEQVAERLVNVALPARIMRGAQHQAAELSWGCRRAARPAGGFCVEIAVAP
jgi:hypothetical protein